MQPRDGARWRKEAPAPTDSLWISGRRPVQEALRAGLPARHLLLRGPVRTGLLAELRREAVLRGVPGEEVDNAELDRVMRHTEHRGAALQLEPLPERSLEQELPALEQARRPLLLVLDGLQDPQNFGAVARSAEAAGVTALVISRWAQAPLSDAAFRASAGALAWLPVLVAEELSEALLWLGRRGYARLGLSERAEKTPADYRPAGPLALVLGGEGRGLSQRVRECLDLELRIPMQGRIGSLNASVAAAVLLFSFGAREEPRAE
ncbi:MAG: RNA methyltransferase [Candidatus Delongbacteria bacterium]